MCLAIAKRPNVTLSRALLQRGFNANSHGAGFAYSKDGKLFVEKGFFEFKPFWEAFNKIQRNNPAIIHFRKVSAGPQDELNCHPFLINEDVCCIHNGTLQDWVGNKKSKKSDTLWFVETILQPIIEDVPDAYLSPVYKFVLEKTIENGNKIVFLDNQGYISILREHAGTWDRGRWFSNNSHKKQKKTENVAAHYPERRNITTKEKNDEAVKQIEEILGGPSRLTRTDYSSYGEALRARGTGSNVSPPWLRELEQMGSSDFRAMMS